MLNREVLASMTPQEELNILLAHNDLSGPRLAAMIDHDRSTVYRWQHGLAPVPKLVLMWLRLYDGARELARQSLAG